MVAPDLDDCLTTVEVVPCEKSEEEVQPIVIAATATATAVADYPIPDQSQSLQRLLIQYEDFAKRLRQLIVSVQAYHDAMVTLSTLSMAVANDMAALAQYSPLASIIGSPRSSTIGGEEITGTASSSSSSNATTFVRIHQSLVSEAEKSRTDYGEVVLSVIVQWEAVVTKRIDADLKREERLRRKVGRHQHRVDILQRKIDGKTSKGKCPSDEQSEKLTNKKLDLKKLPKKHNRFNDNMSTHGGSHPSGMEIFTTNPTRCGEAGDEC